MKLTKRERTLTGGFQVLILVEAMIITAFEMGVKKGIKKAAKEVLKAL